MNVEFPDTFSPELKDMLGKLLERKPDRRLGCQGRGAEEVKSHAFFSALDWNAASKVKLTPPVGPPKGEVNAADAFDIGNFNEDDTKGIKLTKEDDDQYKNFDIFLPDRWQKEITGESLLSFFSFDRCLPAKFYFRKRIFKKKCLSAKFCNLFTKKLYFLSLVHPWRDLPRRDDIRNS